MAKKLIARQKALDHNTQLTWLQRGQDDESLVALNALRKLNGLGTLEEAFGIMSADPVPAVIERTPSTPAPSTGSGGSKVATPVVEAPKYYTADELAQRFGIVNDYATILKEYQDATHKKFDETETTMRRAEASNLRGQESAYNQYLQDLRSRSANAVASGATKGTMVANSLASLLGFQESNREGSNVLNELMYDTAQQRGTALAADVTTARQQANEIGKYLGNLSTSMDTNAINKYAAELAAKAQTDAAAIGGRATTNAARISANSQYDQILNAFTNDYLNKGYNNNAAKSLAYTDYASLVRNAYGKQ